MTTQRLTTIAALKPLHVELPATCGTTMRTINLYQHLPPHLTSTLIAVSSAPKHTTTINHRVTLHNITARVLPQVARILLLLLTADQRFLAQITSLWLVIKSADVRRIRAMTIKADIVIAELPYLFPLVKRNKQQLYVYNAHDVELVLRRAALPPSPISRWLLRRIHSCEMTTCQRADIIITCSKRDKRALQQLYGVPADKIHIVPNGATIPRTPPQVSAALDLFPFISAQQQRLLFIGSDCAANRTAANFIQKKIAPSLPEHTFIIAGSVARNLLTHIPYSRSQPYQRSHNALVTSYGLYDHETWPGDLTVRWSCPQFGLALPPSTSSIELDALSFTPQQVTITHGDSASDLILATIPVTAKRSTITVAIPPQPTTNWIYCNTNAPWKHPGDTRTFGINLSALRYYQHGSWQTADLQTIPDTSVLTHDNVILLPSFTDQERATLLETCDIGLNPITQGSGSNLKLFEYMAAGLPVITTPLGRRGIAGTSGTHFITADLVQFPAAIRTLVDTPALQKTLGIAARQKIFTHYQWPTISAKFGQILTEQLTKKRALA